LHPEPFFEGKVFEQGKVQRGQPRSIEVVATRIADQNFASNRRRKSEIAIDWMEKAFADRSNGLVFLKVEPELDPLRSNPRFIALQKRLNFSD
jgi:hypothetical protein